MEKCRLDKTAAILKEYTQDQYHHFIEHSFPWWFTTDITFDLTNTNSALAPPPCNLPPYLGTLGFFPQNYFPYIKNLLTKKSKTTRVINMINNAITTNVSILWKERNDK